MQKKFNQNTITLHGHVMEEPAFSHSFHEKNYYSFPLEVCRLSGISDRLVVGLTEQQLIDCPITVGTPLTVVGAVRSYNNRSGTGSRLVIRVHSRSLIVEEGEDVNTLTLTGTPCKPPIYRKTPLGRDICDLLVAVNRLRGGADYLPCIAWGSLAVRCGQMEVGTSIGIVGRLQSRIYTKQEGNHGVEHTAYEISVMNLAE